MDIYVQRLRGDTYTDSRHRQTTDSFRILFLGIFFCDEMTTSLAYYTSTRHHKQDHFFGPVSAVGTLPTDKILKSCFLKLENLE